MKAINTSDFILLFGLLMTLTVQLKVEVAIKYRCKWLLFVTMAEGYIWTSHNEKVTSKMLNNNFSTHIKWIIWFIWMRQYMDIYRLFQIKFQMNDAAVNHLCLIQ